ncbi:MAG TPA: TonB-dependent receptor [Sphingomicrobium sp.]|nr:TonB-dependent receptor [Sphingomicrobium sp.]
MSRILLCGIASLAAVTPAWASQPAPSAQPDDLATAATQDEEGAADDTQPAEIVITGTRTILPATALPLTVDVLGGEQLDDQVAVSGSVIDAVAAQMPSFSPTREKLSGSGESLRGRSPLFAINGVPQSTPIRDGSRDGYTIDPFFIDRIEVIYGSNALQGIGATGGVVNQVTVGAPAGEGWSVRTLNQTTAADGFSGNALGGKAAGLAAWRRGAFDAAGGLSFERRGVFLDGEGRRIGVDGTQGEIQDSDSWSAFGRFGWQLSDSARFELIANRFNLEGNGHYVVVEGDRPAGIPTSSELGETEGEMPSNRADLLSASLADSDLAGGNFSAQAFFSRTRDIFGGGAFATFQDPDIDPTGQLFDQSVNRSRKVGGKLTYERPVPGFEALLLTAGVDALLDRTAQSLLLTGREWVPQSDFRSIAPFLQGNLKLLDGKLRLAGGVRRENVTLDIPDFTTLAAYGSRDVEGGSPSFGRTLVNGGVVVEPVDGLRGYAAYAEGYTIADIGRILRGIDTDGVRVDDFLDLEPVVSNNRELGLEWRRGAVSASASYWWSDSDFGSRLVRGADGIFSVVRAPISLEGLDLTAEWRTPVPGLTVGGAYARVEGRTDDDGDGSLEADLDGANIAPNRLNLYGAVERGPFDARLTMRKYLSRRFEGQDPANDFEGYTLFDALLGYRIGAHRVLLGVQNLTDKQYVTYYSDTQGPADNLRFFAGRGRTFTLGVTTDF